MDLSDVNDYLESARAIIGARSPGEIAYDNAVVANLSAGMNIKKAIAIANRKHPKEALLPKPEHWEDLANRYEYLREHKVILLKLGMTET